MCGQRQQFRQINPGVGRGRRLERLDQPEMVDHQPRVGVARCQLSDLLKASRAGHVDRDGVLRGGGEDPVEAGVGRVGRNRGHQKEADADCALGGGPIGDRLGDAGIVRVDRLDQPEGWAL